MTLVRLATSRQQSYLAAKLTEGHCSFQLVGNVDPDTKWGFLVVAIVVHLVAMEVAPGVQCHQQGWVKQCILVAEAVCVTKLNFCYSGLHVTKPSRAFPITQQTVFNRGGLQCDFSIS
jgi:hypothetical protein